MSIFDPSAPYGGVVLAHKAVQLGDLFDAEKPHNPKQLRADMNARFNKSLEYYRRRFEGEIAENGGQPIQRSNPEDYWSKDYPVPDARSGTRHHGLYRKVLMKIAGRK